MKISELKKHYQESSIKFIWEYSTIEEYIPVIERAIIDTIASLQSACDEKCGDNDIRGVIINDNEGKPSKMIFFIKNRKISNLGSIFSNFREQFTILTKGYDDSFGVPILPSNFEQAEIFLKSIGYNKEQVKLKWNEVQSYKRKITTFNTLANKSLNRSRRVPPKIRFRVLSRDKFRCILCGTTSSQSKLHVDHITPVLKSGKNDLENLITLCQECNLGKGIMSVNEWL